MGLAGEPFEKGKSRFVLIRFYIDLVFLSSVTCVACDTIK